jgi:hypothetical protein
MLLVDKLLEDEQLLDTVYEAQGERHPQSRIRGRMQTPAEVWLRLLLLKHIRNWSYDVLEREVRANLVYRAFTRMGDEKGAGRQDPGTTGAVDRAESHCAIAPAGGGTGAGARGDTGKEVAGGYDGGGKQHSLSDRQ